MRLSKNFTLAEMTKSQAAERFGLPNTPGTEDIENLRALCSNVLQPLRDALGPIVINSGYRSYEVNRKIGGKDTSQHCHGMAADIESHSVTNQQLMEWIHAHCTFDQLIAEFIDPSVPGSGWVHVSYNPKGVNRNQALIINKNGTAKWRP